MTAGRSACRAQIASALVVSLSWARVAMNSTAFMPSACGPLTSLWSRSPMWTISSISTPNCPDAAFNKVWHDQFITWTIAERLRVALEGLGRELPDDAFARVVEAHEAMEVDVPPDAVDGIAGALAELATRYKLGVVSDTIVTPGTRLRDLLEVHGLKRYFAGFAFSDEVGHSKPHRAIFEAAAGQLGVEIEEMVHIGDRDHNDVRGPQALGMKAVLFIATRAQDKDTTSADAICARHADLPAVIDRLSAA